MGTLEFYAEIWYDIQTVIMQFRDIIQENSMKPTAILLLHCPDTQGIISEITKFITDNHGNIVYIDQYVDHIENMFFMLVNISNNNNKNTIKPFLLYLENNNKNNFYFCFIPLKNSINDYIYDDEMIYPSLINVKKNNKNLIKMKLVICHLNEEHRNLSSDNLKKNNNNKKKINYFIKEYCANI